MQLTKSIKIEIKELRQFVKFSKRGKLNHKISQGSLFLQLKSSDEHEVTSCKGISFGKER